MFMHIQIFIHFALNLEQQRNQNSMVIQVFQLTIHMKIIYAFRTHV